MSWTVTLLSDWSAAGGDPVADLGPALPGSVVRRQLGGRGTVQLVLDAGIAWPLAIERTIVRVDREDQPAIEARVVNRRRATRGVPGLQCELEAHPRLYDLSDTDLVREVLSGRTIYRFNENLTPRQYLERFVFVNQPADRLTGIRVGVVDFLDRVPLQWDRWTRGQLLDALVKATDAEVQLRVANDGAEELDLLREIGAAAPVLPLFYGGQLRDHVIDENAADLMTVARVAGEAPTADSERATIGENVWRVDAVRVVSTGVHALTLRAPESGESPVIEDGQYVADVALQLPSRYLATLDGSAPQRIVASWVATSEIAIEGSAPPIGARVQIVADAAGTPLETLELPSAIRARGYVVRDLQIVGGRGERQYARNGGHEDGVVEWSSVNGGGGAEYRRTELGVTQHALANGTRAAGTGTGTPFAIDGLEPGAFVRRGMVLEVGGVTLPITANAIPNSLGALVLALGGSGLPGDYPDDSPFTLIRRDVRTLLLDGDQSPLTPRLQFRDSNTDAFSEGSSGTLSNGTYTGTWESARYVDEPLLQAGRVRLQTSVPFEDTRSSIAWPTSVDDVYSLVSAGITITGATTGIVSFLGATGSVLPVVGTRLRYIGQTGRWMLVRVTAISGGMLEVVSDTGGTLVNWSGIGLFEACNVLIPDGTSFTVTDIRETRTLRTNGPHTAGATSVTFKAQANIATRNWVASDTISLARALSATLAITGISSVAGFEDGDGNPVIGMQAAVTFDASASTIDDLTPGLDWSLGEVFFDLGPVGVWRLDSITGGVATLSNGDLLLNENPFTVPQTATASWTRRDTYALTGTASWGTNGRVTLALASPVPTGRSYGRGAPVAASWHPFPVDPLMRLHVALAGGDSTVQLWGLDAFRATTSPSAPARLALYRVWASGSEVPIAGNTLFADATTQANGSGQASVMLSAANGNTIPDSAAVTIRTPALLPITEPRSGSALRLFCAVGGAGEPLSSTPGQRHSLFYVRVPEGGASALTVRSLFTLSEGEWFAGQGPVAAIVDAVGTILGWSSLDEDGIDVEVAPGEVLLTTRATVTASGLYGIRVYGGGTDYRRWCMHVRSLVYVGEALDAPYTRESFSTPLMLTALRRLAQQSTPRIGDRLEVLELRRALAPSLGLPAAVLPEITLGGRVHLEDWDRMVRVTAIEERPGQPVAAIEVGQLTRDGAQLLGAAAVAAGVRRIR